MGKRNTMCTVPECTDNKPVQIDGNVDKRLQCSLSLLGGTRL